MMLARDWRDGKNFFSKNRPEREEVNADNRNALQPLMSQLDALANNHIEHLHQSLVEMRATQLVQCQKLDQMVDSLRVIEREVIRMNK